MKKMTVVTCLFLILFGMISDSDAAFPEKPITILNSSSAGSPTDLLARQIAHHAEKFLGQPITVINKPGGGGGVMFAALLAAPNDGYTIGSTTASQMAVLHGPLKNEFSFDKFDFLCNVQLEPYAIAVLADGPYKSMEDVINTAKKGKDIKFGGQGTGSAMHLMILEMAKQAGVKFTWLPYQGGAESITNLLGNHVEVISTAPATVMQYVEAGQIKVIATSGEKRVAYLPDVPTLKELGLDIALNQYRGIIARKGIPDDIKMKLVEAIRKGVQEPEFKDFMAKSKQEDGYMELNDFAEYAKKDYELMGNMMNLLNK